METVTLTGDYFSIGSQYGNYLKNIDFTVPHTNSGSLAFANESFKILRRSIPELAEEIEGLGYSLKGNFKELLASVLTANVLADGRHTIFAAGKDMTNDNGVILARNYDKHKSLKSKNLRIRTEAFNAYRNIGNTDVLVGRQDGMNEKGLAVAGCDVPSKTVKPGIAPSLLIRAVLDRYSDVNEAANFLTEAKHARAFNYVLADKNGRFGVVEAAPESTNREILNEGSLVVTNHFRSRDMAGFEDVSKRSIDSISRASRVNKLVSSAKSKLDHDKGFEILADHKENVCGHAESIEFNTVWSNVFSPSKGIISTLEGHPCSSSYKRYKI